LLDELNYLYERLSSDQTDELLRRLLTVAPRGGEAMIRVPEELDCSSSMQPKTCAVTGRLHREVGPAKTLVTFC